MNVDIEFLVKLIGIKEVELAALRQQVLELTKQLEAAKESKSE